MPQSNSSGRALEYIIVHTLLSYLKKNKVVLTPRTIDSQKRDLDKFHDLSPKKQDEYLLYSELVLKWLNNKFNISEKNDVLIDRIPDNEAKAGDVTDIRIKISNEVINLSVKHNHFALKHQRPPSLAMQCCFAKNSEEDISFREILKKINNSFHIKRKKLNPNIVSFNGLKKLDNNFIDDNLYKPTCLSVVNFINKNSSKVLANTLFSFLIGNRNFYKIIASNNTIEVIEFANIPIPSKVIASLVKKSYVKLIFSNGWIISMRLHTAATLIGNNPSLKFDTQAIKTNIPSEFLK